MSEQLEPSWWCGRCDGSKCSVCDYNRAAERARIKREREEEDEHEEYDYDW